MMLWGANDDEILNDKTLKYKKKVRVAKQRNGVLATIEFDFKSEVQMFSESEDLESAGSWRKV
jgi:replicative DNA helicase